MGKLITFDCWDPQKWSWRTMVGRDGSQPVCCTAPACKYDNKDKWYWIMMLLVCAYSLQLPPLQIIVSFRKRTNVNATWKWFVTSCWWGSSPRSLYFILCARTWQHKMFKCETKKHFYICLCWAAFNNTSWCQLMKPLVARRWLATVSAPLQALATPTYRRTWTICTSLQDDVIHLCIRCCLGCSCRVWGHPLRVWSVLYPDNRWEKADVRGL